jgi:hypothetical protein
MWNPSSFGGYLAFRLYPQAQILMDGRQGMTYDMRDVVSVEQSEHDPTTFTELTRRLDLQWAVTRAFEGTSSGSPLAAADDWTMVFLDDVAAVYVRRGGPDDRFAASGYRLLRHLTAPAEVLSLALRGGPRGVELAHDGALAQQQAPGSPRATFLEACGALALRDAPRFVAATRLLSSQAPDNPARAVLEKAWRTVAGQSDGPVP